MNLWKNRDFTPMLLKEANFPFDSKDYIFELKFDGIRALIFVSPTSIKIQSRNKGDITYLFPELHFLTKIVKKNVIFDGEIVAFENGKDSFSKIQERIHIKNESKIKNESIENPITYVVFDIIYEGKDLTSLSLLKRKNILNKYKDNNYFVKSKVIDSEGKKLFKSVKKLGLEGIIAKRKNEKYFINKRSDAFIKIKNIKRAEFIIGGYEVKKNNILSLAIGELKNNKLCFVAKASIHEKHVLYKKVKALKRSKNSFTDFNEDIFYVKPILSCHVEYLERTKNGHLRHPIVKDI